VRGASDNASLHQSEESGTSVSSLSSCLRFDVGKNEGERYLPHASPHSHDPRFTNDGNELDGWQLMG
jgi:hypothetical protein